MPTFEIVPAGDVPRPEPTGKRAEILNEYNRYIEQVDREQAGKLAPVGREDAWGQPPRGSGRI
jgi:hypothetical protein